MNSNRKYVNIFEHDTYTRNLLQDMRVVELSEAAYSLHSIIYSLKDSHSFGWIKLHAGLLPLQYSNLLVRGYHNAEDYGWFRYRHVKCYQSLFKVVVLLQHTV